MIPVRLRRPAVNAVCPLCRVRGRRNQGKVDEARRNLKKRLDDECIKRALVSYLYSYISERYVTQIRGAIYSKCGAI